MAFELLPQHLHDALYQALSSGGRANEIYNSVPIEHQQKLATAARVGIPPKKKRPQSALKAAFTKILKHQKPLKYYHFLLAWLESRPFRDEECLTADGWGWKCALDILLGAGGANDCVPEKYQSLLLDLISGRIEKIAKQDQDSIKIWLSNVIILRAIAKSESDYAAFVRSVKKAWGSDEIEDERKHWFSVASMIASNVDAYRSDCLEMADTIKSCLSFQVEQTDFPYEIPEGEGPLLELFHNTNFFETLKANSNTAIECCNHPSEEEERIMLLLGLAARLRPEPPARDFEELVRESEALKEVCSSGDVIDLTNTCPTLETLGRIFLDNESVDEPFLEKFDLLSRKFSRMIENDEFTLAPIEGSKQEDSTDSIEVELETPDEEALPSELGSEEVLAEEEDNEYSEAVEVPEPETPNSNKEHSIDETIAFASQEELSDEAAHTHALEVEESQDDEVELSTKEPTVPAPPLPVADEELGARPSQEIAQKALESWGENLNSAHQLQASLLYEGEYDWFYLFSTSWKDNEFTPWVSEVLELGAQYQPGFTSSEERLEQLFQDLEDIDKAGAMAVLAGAIRPSLMIPHVYPQAALDKANEELGALPNFKNFIDALKDFATKRFPLSEDYLQGLDSLSSFEKNKEQHVEELQVWLEQAFLRRNKFQVATRIWKQLAGPKGRLRSLVEDVLDKAKYSNVKDRLSQWRNKGFLDKVIEAASKGALGDNQREKVKYGARERLVSDIENALDLVGQHLDFQKREQAYSKRDNDFIKSSFSTLRQLAEKLQIDVEPFTRNQSSYHLMAAAQALLLSLKEVATSFKDVHARKGVSDPVLNREFLRLCIPDWEHPKCISITEGDTLKSIAEFLAGPISITKSFRLHLEKGHLECAEKLMPYAGKEHPEKEEDYQGELQDSQLEWQRKADHGIDRLSNLLQDYLLRGIIDEDKHSEDNSSCARMKRQIENDIQTSPFVCRKVARIEFELDEIKESLCVEHHKKVDAILKEIESKGLKAERNLKATLQKHLDNGAIGLIKTYLDVLRKGLNDGYIQEEELPSESKRKDYFVEFSSCANKIAKVANRSSQLPAVVRRGKLQCLPQLTTFDEETLSQRAEIMRSWEYLSGKSKDLHRALQSKKALPKVFSLLRWLGFDVKVTEILKEIPPHGHPNFWRPYIVKAYIDDSPIPRFGSKAQGKHHLVFVWNTLEPENLANWLKNQVKDNNAPVWVFHFASLTLEDRWQRVVACRKVGLTPILIDTTLLTWLCGLPSGETTRALFDICMTGAHDNPYTPDSGGATPKEMFYGRKDDIQRLWDPEGPCILYGGRQLGKSSLLRRVEREYHDVDQQKYVFYVGIQPGDNLWDIFRRTMVEAQLLNNRGQLKPTSVKNSIKKLLDDEPSMRIMFLLDECDELLNEDSQKKFEQLILLRDLMAQTERRFKAVFTGLHNVQRYERMPNQPLAHFGAPLRIGPLAPGDAEKLVQEPLTLLGYDMEQQIVHQVLAQTNYHPSLIQLFCYELVRSMQGARRNFKSLPPITIDNRTVSQVWRRTDLSQRMKDRFDWTLNLDKRYRVIGYVMAVLELFTDNTDVTQRGFDIFTIMKEVKTTWPQGFKGTSHDELAGLLDELEGLGVVARQGRDRYRLKNSNVITLLGGESGIEDELDRFSNMKPDENPTPEVIHRLDDNNKIASPLTLKQEGDILGLQGGIHCVFGSNALGLSGLLQALAGALTKENKQSPHLFDKGPIKDVPTWVHKIYKESPHKDDATFFLDVSGQPEGQVVECINKLATWDAGRRSEKRVVRIILALDPSLLVAFVNNNRIDDFDDVGGVNFYYMSKWKKLGLNRWFHEVGIPGTTEIDDWMEISGGWHSLLNELQRRRMTSSQSVNVKDDLSSKLLSLPQKVGLSDDSDVERLFGVLVALVEAPSSEEDVIELLHDEFGDQNLPNLFKILTLLGLLVETENGVMPDPILAGQYKKVFKGGESVA